MTLNELHDTLEHLRKEYNPAIHERGRVTHCHLVYTHTDGREHIFEVRSWKPINDEGILCINAVNWTICAGTCTIEMTEERLKDWRVCEDIFN